MTPDESILAPQTTKRDRYWIEGIVPPVVTPQIQPGVVDAVGLEHQLVRLLEAGVDGIFILGSSGEGALLTEEQRDRVVEITCGAVARAVPVLVGTLETSPYRVVEAATRVAKAKASAIVATAPFYGQTHPAEIEDHFRLIHEQIELPLIAYDVPPAVHTSLQADSIARLANDGVIAGLKDSSGSESRIRQILPTVGQPDFPILTGSELAVDWALQGGAAGAVPGLANVDPYAYVRLYAAAQRGDFDTCRIEQNRLAALFDIVGVGDRARLSSVSAGLGAFKAALVCLGIIENDYLAPPLRSLAPSEVELVEARLKDEGLV